MRDNVVVDNLSRDFSPSEIGRPILSADHPFHQGRVLTQLHHLDRDQFRRAFGFRFYPP